MQAWRAVLWGPGAYLSYTKSAFHSKAKAWDPKALDVPLAGVLTRCAKGANAGLGLATAEALAKRGGTVHMICRSKERGEQARVGIVDRTKNQDVHLHILDVSLPNAVKAWAKSFVDSGVKVDVLVNNAGVLLNKREKTADGLDACFATNLLGTFLVTELLMPALQRAAPSRVITVSSGGMYTAKLDADDLQFEKMKEWDGVAAYAQTKRAQVYLNEIWAEKYTKDTGVSFYCMHPGWAETPGVQTSLPQFHDRFKDNLRSPEEGADTIIWLAITSSVSVKESGKFYFDREVVSPHLTLGGTHSSAEDVAKLHSQLRKIGAVSDGKV